MFHKINIRRFRLFKNLTVGPLHRFNLVTGRNASGKTSFLEALFLAAGANNARLAMSLYQFRGAVYIHPQVDHYFRTLFFGLDTNSPAEIVVYGDFVQKSKLIKRRLTIQPIIQPTPTGATTDPASILSGVEFSFKGPNGATKGSVEWGTITEHQPPFEIPSPEQQLRRLVSDVPPTKDLVPGRFVSPYHRTVVDQIGTELSSLRKQRKMSEVIEALQLMDSRVLDIVPLTEFGVTSIYVDVGPPTLLPISVMGGGFFNCLRMVVEAVFVQNGILLIDEIENGIHHSVVKDIIKFLLKICVKNNIQIFATTHSDEIVRTFAQSAQEIEFDDLAIYQFYWRNKKPNVMSYEKEAVFTLNEINLEIR